MTTCKKKEFFENMKEEIAGTLEMMDALIEKYQNLENENLDVKKLVELYKAYIEKLVYFRAYAMLPNLLSLGNITIFDSYRKMLSKNLSNQDYSILTTPEDITDTSIAELEMLKLIRDNKTSDEDLDIWAKK